MNMIKFLTIYYYTCPNCGAAVTSSTTNGSSCCSRCHTWLVIKNGSVVGTK